MTTEQRTADALPATPVQAAPHKIQEAVEARDALAQALSRAGIQLPAMDIRSPWSDETRGALVHLGVCSAPVALALAAVIEQGIPR
ncbi:hypothetical protein [Streptomyces sp. NBC_00690]|uniref:hypothetical protein n=1 Tax=Streptomyces sp. NBC_00690 TaxID=2975808 RepID=UPI002E2DC0F3|nr:hypothetical protein [Streptomyces sp. NBC_00690]